MPTCGWGFPKGKYVCIHIHVYVYTHTCTVCVFKCCQSTRQGGQKRGPSSRGRENCMHTNTHANTHTYIHTYMHSLGFQVLPDHSPGSGKGVVAEAQRSTYIQTHIHTYIHTCTVWASKCCQTTHQGRAKAW